MSGHASAYPPTGGAQCVHLHNLPDKLDSENVGHEAGDQTDGLIEPCDVKYNTWYHVSTGVVRKYASRKTRPRGRIFGFFPIIRPGAYLV